MKIRNIFMYGMAFFCFFLISKQATGQNIVKDVDITSDQAKVKMADPAPSSYFIEIGGPDNYYHKQTVNFTNEISLSSIQANGEKFEDGLYSLQVTPIFKLTDEQVADLSEMRVKNDEAGMAAYRKLHNLPDVVDKFNMNFSIRNGEFVVNTQQEGELNLPTMSSQWEIHHPSLYASVNTIGLDYADHATDNSALATGVAQVFTTDVIVQGSICVGFDCVNGESFGFDTQRLKENNLRIHFNDTSTSASFPSNDWRIVANDTSNGGANYLGFEDSTAGRMPFRVEAGAPANSLVVESDGDIGIGTLNPVVETHIVDGDTPTLRLEQDGSSGFQQQTWDVAGNETNFFVRDVSNSSTLPFKITPGAPNNLLYLKGGTSDNIGIKTTSPNTGSIMHFNATNSIVLPLGTDAERPAATEGMLRGNSTSNILEYYNGSSWVDLATGGVGNWSTTGSDLYYNLGNVGIGTNAPSELFHIKTSGNPVSFIETTGGANSARYILKTPVRQWNIGTHAAGGVSGGFFWYDNTAGEYRLYIDPNGDIGMGTTTPSHKLHVCGTIGATSATVNVITCSSDARFKKNISPLQKSLEKVLALQGINYDWRVSEFPEKNFVEGQQLGFIAQDIEAIFPSMVLTDKEGYKSVDYSRLTPVLVEAVKEQQQIIDAQQAEIDDLKSQVASLEELKAQVAALTQMVMNQNEKDAAKTNTQVGEE